MKNKKTPAGWPSGQPRADISPDWPTTRKRVRRYIATHWRGGVVSVSAVANEIGVHRSTLGNWLAGMYVPPAEMQELLLNWIKNMEEEHSNFNSDAKNK